MTYIEIGFGDLVLASILVIFNGILSLVLRLRLEQELAVATVRMIVQLILVGLVLKALFAIVSPLWTGVAALAMVLFAAREITARQDRRLSGVWAYGLGTGCLLIAATLIAMFALTTQLNPEPWYHPRYAIPILGMVLGNTMTGISLGLHALTTGAARERVAIEAHLALGEMRTEAFRPATRGSLKSALMPIVNSMAATGLVALPGMMTGQILAGAEPVSAVKYQILIMFLIAGGTGLGALAAVMGAAYRLTDSRHRLRLDRLTVPAE